MATIQTRKGKNGESYRVGYYDENGKFTFTPTLKNRDGAERIAQIIDRQGYKVALKILNVKQRSEVTTLEQWFRKSNANPSPSRTAPSPVTRPRLPAPGFPSSVTTLWTRSPRTPSWSGSAGR